MSFCTRRLRTTSCFTPLALVCGGLIACDGAAPPDEPVQQDTLTTAQREAPPPPDYLVNPPANPRLALTEALDAGLLAEGMTHNEKLRAMLKVAGVPEASQVLVFSKTSLQLKLIGPSNPRAIYFSDNCYIAYVPGGLIEYGDTDPDPKVGSGLLAVDPRDNAGARFETDPSCLSCHDGARTNGRPGFFIRSVFPDPQGHVITSAGSITVGQDTPLAKRWGGWYVTGNSGSAHHRGNQVTVEQPNGSASIDNEKGSNLNDLSQRFRLERYLEPTSDIVALMVLEYQVQMHNLLTQGRSVVTEQYERSRSLAEYSNEPFDPEKSETLQRVVRSNAERIVRHMLYCDEVVLTDPVSGSQRFINQFRANRKEDSQGRSLKDFDLQTRMFKNRCSYMVYSQAFDLLPPMLKDAVLSKLSNALQGNGDAAVYGHLEPAERQAILAILQETGVLEAHG
eukprot:g13413.t1